MTKNLTEKLNQRIRFLLLLKYFNFNVSPNLFKQITLPHNILILKYRRVAGEGGKFLRPDK